MDEHCDSLSSCVGAKLCVQRSSAAPVHDPLESIDQGVDLAIVPPKVIRLNAPDHDPAQLQAVHPLRLQSHAICVVKSNLQYV